MVWPWVKPVLFSLFPNIGGFLGGTITKNNMKFYDSLVQPSWKPPKWLFAPVWTTIYTSSGYASYLIWKHGGGFDGEGRTAMMIYAASLTFNWIWTPIFFGAHKIRLGFFDIAATWLAVAGCVYTFHPISTTASYIMIPYLAWLTYAGSLNFFLWRHNPQK